jgi:hypothetical protein
MKIDKVKKLSTKERLLYWISEREKIRIARESNQQKPWTDDEILQSYKFCNVRRMDDRVSRWLNDNWYIPYCDHPNMLTATTLARQLNNTESLEAVGFPTRWNPEKAEQILNERSSDGKKNFSAAYMITGTLGGTKVQQIVHKVVTPIHRAVRAGQLQISTTFMQSMWELLLPFAGFSSFISGQVVADLRWGVSGLWIDKEIWAPYGPGSKRGLNRFFDRDKNTPMKDTLFSKEFNSYIGYCVSNLDRTITSRLEAMDFQNCLCEFDKYERTLWEGRRPKQKYSGL